MESVLLYDGACGFCAAIVQRILRHDRRGTLRFAALEGRFAAAVRARHPELGGVESMVWVEPGDGAVAERVLVRSDAALAVARYLGGWWTVTLLARAAPRAMRDAVYGFIARHRHRLPGAGPSCVVPTPDVRARFLD